MRNLPDVLTILRPSGEDEYGNLNASWETPSETEVRAFIMGGQAFFRPDADVRHGDRFWFRDRAFKIDGRPQLLRSPSRDIVQLANLIRIADTKTPEPISLEGGTP